MNPYDPYNTDMTEEERELLRQYNEAQNYGAIGATAGSAIGAGLGLVTAPIGGLAFIPQLMGAGGAIGGLIGGGIGGSQAERAQRELERLRTKTEKASVEKEARNRAFQQLLGRYNVYGL